MISPLFTASLKASPARARSPGLDRPREALDLLERHNFRIGWSVGWRITQALGDAKALRRISRQPAFMTSLAGAWPRSKGLARLFGFAAMWMLS